MGLYSDSGGGDGQFFFHEDDPEDSFLYEDIEMVRQEIREREAQIRDAEESIPGWFSLQFGEWTFDPEELLLVHGRGDYVIELDRITNSACMLDWIMQVHRKEWSTPEDIFCLLVAFRRILDPQKNYCAFEEPLEASGEELAQRYAEKAEQSSEEVKALEELEAHSNLILKFIPMGKQVPLSLITESVDLPHQKIIDTIKSLHMLGVVNFDMETKYVSLKEDLVFTEKSENKEEEKRGDISHE